MTDGGFDATEAGPRRRARVVSAFFPGLYCAAVDKHTGSIDTHHGNGTARHILIATADRDKTIESLGADHCFDGIRDDFA